MVTSRRTLLFGLGAALAAAPAVIQVGNLMRLPSHRAVVLNSLLQAQASDQFVMDVMGLDGSVVASLPAWEMETVHIDGERFGADYLFNVPRQMDAYGLRVRRGSRYVAIDDDLWGRSYTLPEGGRVEMHTINRPNPVIDRHSAFLGTVVLGYTRTTPSLPLDPNACRTLGLQDRRTRESPALWHASPDRIFISQGPQGCPGLPP